MNDTQLKLVNGFSHLLQSLEGGALHADLCEQLQDTMTEMATYAAGPGGGRAKASLTLTINFEQEAEMVRIRTAVKTKSQEIPRRPSALFLTPSNKLSLEHPMQNALPFGVATMHHVPQSQEQPHVRSMVQHSDLRD